MIATFHLHNLRPLCRGDDVSIFDGILALKQRVIPRISRALDFAHNGWLRVPRVILP